MSASGCARLSALLISTALFASGCTSFRVLMYEGPGRDRWQEPERVLQALNLERGASVADIGSGGGYFTFRLAEAVGPLGRVYAVDIDTGLLDYVAVQARKYGHTQIEIINAEPDDPRLPAGALDLVFTSNTYHHLEDRESYFKRLRESLKPGGRVAIIDYRPGWFSRHATAGEQIVDEMRAAGYELEQRHDFLSRQEFLVFAPASG